MLILAVDQIWRTNYCLFFLLFTWLTFSHASIKWCQRLQSKVPVIRSGSTFYSKPLTIFLCSAISIRGGETASRSSLRFSISHENPSTCSRRMYTGIKLPAVGLFCVFLFLFWFLDSWVRNIFGLWELEIAPCIKIKLVVENENRFCRFAAWMTWSSSCREQLNVFESWAGWGISCMLLTCFVSHSNQRFLTYCMGRSCDFFPGITVGWRPVINIPQWQCNTQTHSENYTPSGSVCPCLISWAASARFRSHLSSDFHHTVVPAAFDVSDMKIYK